jgi:hypothetical protein
MLAGLPAVGLLDVVEPLVGHLECTSLSGGPRTVQIAGQGPVPAGVSSVLASVTVFGAASVGVLQAYPAGGSAPGGLSMVFNGPWSGPSSTSERMPRMVRVIGAHVTDVRT